MIKNLCLLFMARFIYRDLDIKNLGYYNRTTAYEVLSVTSINDLYDLFLYEIKDLGTQDIKSYVSKTDAHFIIIGEDKVKLKPGFKFCVKSTNKKQGRDFLYERYVLE